MSFNPANHPTLAPYSPRTRRRILNALLMRTSSTEGATLYFVLGGFLLCIPLLFPSLIGIGVWLIGEALVLYLIRRTLLWRAVRKHGPLLARIAREFGDDARPDGRSPD